MKTVKELTNLKKDAVLTGPFGSLLHSSDYVESGIPLILVRNIKAGKIDEKNIPYITEKDAQRLSKYRLKEGDIIFSRVGRVGSAALGEKKHEGWLISGQTLRIRFENSQIIPKFINYFFQSKLFTKILSKEILGMTRDSINTSILSQIPVLVPPLNEQQKITSILSNIDSLIESYDRIIIQTKRLKTGLMQQLLTKGIHHKKFKKVKWFYGKEIEIPENWKYPKFHKVVEVNPYTKIEEEIVPYVPMDSVDTSKPHFNYYEKRKVSDYPSLPKFQENDVLFASITPSTENGKTCIVENFPYKGIGSSELTVLRPLEEIIPKYLYYYIKSHRVRQFAISQMMGTTGRQRVPDYVFKKDLHFELPSKIEQKKIASILSNVDKKINHLEAQRTNLENLSESSREELLTGKIRV